MASDDGWEDLRMLVRGLGAEEEAHGDASLSDQETLRRLLIGLEERLAVVRAAVRARIAGIDAQIAALRAEGFSQGNVTRMARLIQERGSLVLQMGQFTDVVEKDGRPG